MQLIPKVDVPVGFMCSSSPPIGGTRPTCGSHNTATTVKWAHATTCHHKLRLRVFGGDTGRRQQQSARFCLLSPPSSVFRSRKVAVHKPMLREDLASRYRLTTTAADKASVFTEFMAVVREEEEEAGSKWERCRSQLPVPEGKKWPWDHNGARRNSSVRARKHGAAILHSVTKETL